MVSDAWWQDLRLAWRGLRRARAFTGSAVLTLAVGIAGTTVMFALVVAQVALAVGVVAAASVLTRSLLRLQAVDMGLAADRL